MAVNDVKTWIGSTGPFLSDSSKPVSGLQTDKLPLVNNDVIRLIDTRNLGNPVVIPSGVDFIIKPNYQLIIGNQIDIQGTLDIQGELIVEEIPIVLTASDIVNVPSGNIAATNVQSAINEIDTEKAPALGPDDNYVTDAEKIIIGNTSGTNTGDQVGDGTTITGTGTVGDPFVSSAGGTSRAQIYAIGSLRI